MNTLKFVLSLLMACISMQLNAQNRGTYTLIQAGGNIGLAASDGRSPMNGYQFSFTFGRNFYDRMYLGLGIGSDVYRGRTTLADGSRSTRRVNTLPIVVDFRLPVAPVTSFGTLGAVANAGYAPRIGGDYFKGFTAKAGLTYTHLLVEGSDLLFSAGYGYQQIDSRFSLGGFDQHNVFITVGLFVH